MLIAADMPMPPPPTSTSGIGQWLLALLAILIGWVLNQILSEWRYRRTHRSIEKTSEVAETASRRWDEMYEVLKGNGILGALKAIVQQMRQMESKQRERLKRHSDTLLEFQRKFDLHEQLLKGKSPPPPKKRTKVEAGEVEDTGVS